MEDNKYSHYLGGVVSFRGRLTAIAGQHTTQIEDYYNSTWVASAIPDIPVNSTMHKGFSSVVINDTLFAFGKLHVE